MEEYLKVEQNYKDTYEPLVFDKRDNMPDLLKIKKIFYVFDLLLDKCNVNKDKFIEELKEAL